MLREEKALLVGGGVIAMAAAAGIFALVSGGEDNPVYVPPPVAHTPVTPAPAPAPQNTAALRAEQLARMFNNDRTYAGGYGYVIVDTAPRAQGRCTEEATVNPTGWYGGDTGLLYQAEKGGALYTMCFSHDDEVVTRARAMPLTPAPQVQAPAEPQVDQVALDRLIAADRAYLNERGYRILGGYEALGTCEDRGASGVFNDNAGWRGNTTGIMYTIADEYGDRYWACASHDRNGRVVDMTAAPK